MQSSRVPSNDTRRSIEWNEGGKKSLQEGGIDRCQLPIQTCGT